MNVQQQIKSAFQREMLGSGYNVIRPALSKDSLQGISLINAVMADRRMPADAAGGKQPAVQVPGRTSEPSSKETAAHQAFQAPAVLSPRERGPVPQAAPGPVIPAPAAPPASIKIPPLEFPLRKGQKTALNLQQTGSDRLRVCFGWNVLDARCDVDVSAFLITQTGKVMSDEWFVFYGQPNSPDRSVTLTMDGKTDREIIRVDLQRLHPQVQKIVFVITINEAFENHLNFSMLKDTYIRLLDDATGREIASFQLEEDSCSVTSMTMAELYLHNGQWKINPVGNGVNRDLAGQCAIYGVEIC